MDNKITVEQYFYNQYYLHHDQLKYAVIVPVIQQKQSIYMMAIFNFPFLLIWIFAMSIVNIQKPISLQLRKVKILKKYFFNSTGTTAILSNKAFTFTLTICSLLANIFSVGYLFQYKPQQITINTIADLNKYTELDLLVSEDLDISWITSK